MLTLEQRSRLIELEAGTPMGDLLRRYWYPVAARSQLPVGGVQPVTLLGESLVLFRPSAEELGLLQRSCPHRGVDLSYGVVERGSLICPYHGWAFNGTGQCTAMPAEPEGSPLRCRVRASSYPVQEMGGLIWAYLGPEPAPLLPRFDLFVWDGCLRDIGQATLPCHWLQIMENSVDPHHLEAMHGHHLRAIRLRQGSSVPTHYLRRHRRVGFDRFRFGIIKRRLLEGQQESCDDWAVGHPLVFPSMVRVGSGQQHRMQIRVPVDRTTTWHLWYSCYRPRPGQQPVQQEQIPLYDVPWLGPDGRHLVDTVDGQDIMAWVSPGPIADRSREILATSDRGIHLLRQMLIEEMERVAHGHDPLGTVRNPLENDCIALPQEDEKYGEGNRFLAESLQLGHARYSPIFSTICSLLDPSTNEA